MGEPQVKITLGLARFLHGVLSSHLEHEDFLLDAYMDRHSELDAAISMAEQEIHPADTAESCAGLTCDRMADEGPEA